MEKDPCARYTCSIEEDIESVQAKTYKAEKSARKN